MTGDHDHRHAVVMVAEKTQQVDAVAIGQAYVEHAHIRSSRGDAGAEFRRGPADDDTESFAFQNHLEGKPDVGFVIDDEDAFGCHVMFVFSKCNCQLFLSNARSKWR